MARRPFLLGVLHDARAFTTGFDMLAPLLPTEATTRGASAKELAVRFKDLGLLFNGRSGDELRTRASHFDLVMAIDATMSTAAKLRLLDQSAETEFTNIGLVLPSPVPRWKLKPLGKRFLSAPLAVRASVFYLASLVLNLWAVAKRYRWVFALAGAAGTAIKVSEGLAAVHEKLSGWIGALIAACIAGVLAYVIQRLRSD